MKTDVVVAGWGQVTQPKVVEGPPKDPLGLMAEAARRAAANLRHPGDLALTEGILVVKSLSAHYETPAQDLAQDLRIDPKFTFESRIGGNSPQTLVNRAASMIARRELNMALVVGAEAYVPRGPQEAVLDSALLKGVPKGYQGADSTGVTPLEQRYGIEHPMQGFPLFETALWAESGLDLTAYMAKVAELWSRFSQVAASHPHAWVRQPKSPAEILTPTAANRPIAFPYLKFMNAYITVDQGAAVILMSEEFARAHGPAQGRPVYFCGGGYAEDRQPYMIQKTAFTQSPPLKAAVDKALTRAGMTLDQMDCFDLYSCFPCAVSIAKKMLELKDQETRPLTLTGGLGFFGGPGNNYNLHAVATLCQMIAEQRADTGLVTALGWFMQKHAAGIYSANRPKRDLSFDHPEDQDHYLAGPRPIEIVENPSGTGIIETYTLVYERNGEPGFGVIYGRTENGLRFIARICPEHFTVMSSKNLVSARVALKKDPDTFLTTAFLL